MAEPDWDLVPLGNTPLLRHLSSHFRFKKINQHPRIQVYLGCGGLFSHSNRWAHLRVTTQEETQDYC